MPRKGLVSPELGLETLLEIAAKNRDQSAYTRMTCPGCPATPPESKVEPIKPAEWKRHRLNNLVAVPSRTEPGSGLFCCTVCGMIITMEGQAQSKLYS